MGNTPLLPINKLNNQEDIDAVAVAKAGILNLGESIKDRIVFSMIKDAKKKGISET